MNYDNTSIHWLETLDILMVFYLSAPHDLIEVDWNDIYDVWEKMKMRNPLPLVKWIHDVNDVTLNTFKYYQRH